MAIYSKGKKVKSIYVKGKPVNKVFVRGKATYENYPQLLGSMRLDITSNNNNSVSGYMTFAKYLDFDKELNMEVIRYETALKELENFEGVVNLAFPEDCIILVNGLRMSTANKKAVISGQELNGLNGFITTNQSWPDSLETTSDYIQPIYGLQLGTAVGFLTVTNGYCIASNNRDSRLNLSMQGSYNLSSIGVTSDGTYPVYAVATSTGIENQITIISCNTMTVQASPLFRHIGWLTKTGNNTSVVSLGTPISGSNFSKSATSPNIVVSGGWGTDTAGYQVKVSSSSTSFSSDIASVTKENTKLINSRTSTLEVDSFIGATTSSMSSQLYLEKGQTTGGMKLKITGSGTRLGNWSFYSECSFYYDNNGSFHSNVVNRSNPYYITVPTGTFANRVFTQYGGDMVETNRDLTHTTSVYQVTYNPTITKKLYHYAKYDKNSSAVTNSTLTTDTTPTSDPYNSYVFIGTVIVQSETGTLSIS